MYFGQCRIKQSPKMNVLDDSESGLPLVSN